MINKISLNNRKFALLANSENGEVSTETIFYYKQKNELITANYDGGSVRYGKIIARFIDENTIEMLYQCLTVDSELKAGRAIAKVSITHKNKIQLDLNWSWINGDKSSGTSTYIEID